MEITIAYALALGGFFLALICLTFYSQITTFLTSTEVLVTQHLVYLSLLHRYRYIGLWSRADVLMPCIFAGRNFLCLFYKYKDIPSLSSRAARISLINMIPAFTSPHLSATADVWGVPLNTCYKIHKLAGYISSLFFLIHILIVLAGRIPFSLRVGANAWAVVVITFS